MFFLTDFTNENVGYYIATDMPKNKTLFYLEAKHLKYWWTDENLHNTVQTNYTTCTSYILVRILLIVYRQNLKKKFTPYS